MTDAELDDLVARFRDGSLPASEWTHAAHLAVGTWHVCRCGEDEALRQVRDGILALNAAHGTPNTDTRGYHETITRAYIRLLAQFVPSCGLDPGTCVRRLMQDELSAKNVLLRYYSKSLLASVAARRGWVEPDLFDLVLPVPPG